MNFSASLLNRKYGFLHKNNLNDIKALSYLIGMIHYFAQHSCIHQELLMMNLSLVQLLNSNFQFSIKSQVNFQRQQFPLGKFSSSQMLRLAGWNSAHRSIFPPSMKCCQRFKSYLREQNTNRFFQEKITSGRFMHFQKH